MPAVSVVLPVRNAVSTLGRAFKSLRGQTWTDWELIAVDDGSVDGGRELLEQHAATDARIRVLANRGAGLVSALNTGLAEARGGLIARMDADDESHVERLSEQVGLLGRDPRLGLVSCLVNFGGDRERSAGYARHVDWLNDLVDPEAIALNRFVESPLAHPSVMFRRELVDRYGGYRDGDFPEDYELWLRWLDGGVRMAKAPRVLYAWHDTPGRLSRTDPRYDPENFFRLKAAWVARELRRTAGSRDVLVWGAGRPTRRRAAHLETHGVRIAAYVDIDPRKIGRTVGDVPVRAPADLPPADGAFVLGYVGSRGARELIREALRGRGFAEGRDFMMCA